MLSHRGYLQDDQEKVPLNRVTGVSISLKDRTDGPFSLEVDSIGTWMRPLYSNVEDFAYESYLMPEKGFTQKM